MTDLYERMFQVAAQIAPRLGGAWHFDKRTTTKRMVKTATSYNWSQIRSNPINRNPTNH